MNGAVRIKRWSCPCLTRYSRLCKSRPRQHIRHQPTQHRQPQNLPMNHRSMRILSLQQGDRCRRSEALIGVSNSILTRMPAIPDLVITKIARDFLLYGDSRAYPSLIILFLLVRAHLHCSGTSNRYSNWHAIASRRAGEIKFKYLKGTSRTALGNIGLAQRLQQPYDHT